MAKRKGQFPAKFSSPCYTCGKTIEVGDMARYVPGVRKVEHVDCKDGAAAPLVLSTLKPSPYQQVLFDDVITGEGNLVVEAVAGSGKTWTIIETLKRLVSHFGKVNPNNKIALFLAFNRHIAKELQSKLQTPFAEISTAHSFGLRCLRNAHRIGSVKFQVNDEKTKQILLHTVFDYDILDKDEVKSLYSMLPALRRVISLAKGHLVMSPLALRDCWRDLVNKFDITLPDERLSLYDFEATLLLLYQSVLEDKKKVDFDDMIFLPLYRKVSIPSFPFVFVDEAQDLNPAQQELVAQAGRHGRVIAVGDRNQAIYGFAGADTASIPNLIAKLEAKVLPLSICYRCGTDIVEAAKEIVPQIEAAPNAVTGSITALRSAEFEAEIKDGDYAICRVTAPLVQYCLKFIRDGRKATIIGRDIGKDLTALVKSLADRDDTIVDFVSSLERWTDKQLEKISKRHGAENQQIAVEDKNRTLIALSEHCTTVGGILDRIEAIFSDDASAGITLSTVHRAKGLEADRIHILRPDLMPHPLAKQQWQLEQEHNLRYVAITRAKEQLFFVEE